MPGRRADRASGRGASGWSWLQANVALQRREGQALPGARALFARLEPWLAERRGASIRGWWFVRKPPDLRLRIAAAAPAACERELALLLQECREAGSVASWFFSAYEPELAQFGGPEVMELVHAHFEADSDGWLLWDRRARGPAPSLPPHVLSLHALNDLFFRVLEASEEVWDVWWNLARLHPRLGSPAPLPAPRGLSSLAPMAAADEQPLIAHYLRANQALARGLDELLRSGRLRYGRRALLPFVALFHWNRYGLDLDARARLYGGMTAALDPKRCLRGVEVG